MDTPVIKPGKKRARKLVLIDDDDDVADNENVPDVNLNNGDAVSSDSNADNDHPQNLCQICSVDMGDGNPRQLCGKTKCLNNVDIDSDIPSYSSSSFQTPKKKKRTFISLEEFSAKVARETPTKWADLEKVLYIVNFVEDRPYVKDDEELVDSIAELMVTDDSERTLRVWLPSVVKKKLKEQMVEGKTTYLYPKGKTMSKAGRGYHDADVTVVDDDYVVCDTI